MPLDVVCPATGPWVFCNAATATPALLYTAESRLYADQGVEPFCFPPTRDLSAETASMERSQTFGHYIFDSPGLHLGPCYRGGQPVRKDPVGETHGHEPRS